MSGHGPEANTYYQVEVCDDHDGGSVWIVEEDYMPDQSDAAELAQKFSRIRDNKSARVRKVVTEVVLELQDGEAVVSDCRSVAEIDRMSEWDQSNG